CHGWSPWVRLTRLLADYIPLHPAQSTEQLILLLGPHLELVQALDQVLHEGVELRVRDLHALVGGLHGLALVRAGAAGGLTDLVHEHGLELRDVRVREALVDARVTRDVADEIVNDCRDRRLAAEPVVEGLLLCHRGVAARAAGREYQYRSEHSKRPAPRHRVSSSG